VDHLNNISQEEFEKIEAYLSNQLSDAEKAAFDEKLENDIHFKAKVEEVKTIVSGIEAQVLKEQLDIFHEELSTDKKMSSAKNPKVVSFNWKRMAAAAVIIIGLGSFWLLSGNSNDRLYAEYFSPDPGLPTTMGNTDNYEFFKAMVSYKQGDYDEALIIWKDQLKNNVSSDTLSYFIGSALLADKKETEAISYLTYVTKQEETVFKSEAYFYLGLAYLKAGKVEEAIEVLEKSDLKKAKDLLNKLN